MLGLPLLRMSAETLNGLPVFLQMLMKNTIQVIDERQPVEQITRYDLLEQLVILRSDPDPEFRPEARLERIDEALLIGAQCLV